ncbi:MAG: hypothetical protein HFJ33_05065 [Clostridia bacterium]|nr:hypothetical protein [Clostridia bacterium]
MKKEKGITLIALIITIIILLILAGVTIASLTGENGILSKSQKASTETEKQTATEKMNLKITNIQIETYGEKQQMPSLQELADGLCEDNEMQYVLTESKKQASLEKIEVGEAKSIFTKLKEYPYEFEIDNELKLASINGVKVSTTENNDNYEELSAQIENLKKEINILKNETILNKRIKLITEEVKIPITNSIQDLGDIELSDSIENYKYLEIQSNILTAETNGALEETRFFATEQLNYNNSNELDWSKKGTFLIKIINGDGAFAYLNCWLKDDKTIHVGGAYGSAGWQYLKIENIYGIK